MCVLYLVLTEYTLVDFWNANVRPNSCMTHYPWVLPIVTCQVPPLSTCIAGVPDAKPVREGPPCTRGIAGISVSQHMHLHAESRVLPSPVKVKQRASRIGGYKQSAHKPDSGRAGKPQPCSWTITMFEQGQRHELRTTRHYWKHRQNNLFWKRQRL